MKKEMKRKVKVWVMFGGMSLGMLGFAASCEQATDNKDMQQLMLFYMLNEQNKGPKAWGYVNGIPVYSNVTDAQMAGVVANVEAGYSTMSGGTQSKIDPSKVSKIVITDGINTCIADLDDAGKFIISLSYLLTSSEIKGGLEYYANNQLASIQIDNSTDEKTIKMANSVITPIQTLRLDRGRPGDSHQNGVVSLA